MRDTFGPAKHVTAEPDLEACLDRAPAFVNGTIIPVDGGSLF
jgi:hypothetical protein